jgi:presequence protease
MYSGNPFVGLEFDKPLSENKLSVHSHLMESLVDKFLVNNPHSLLLTLKPEPGLQSEKDRLLAEELATFKASLSEDQIDTLIKETHQLIQFQQSEDTPEAIATIPMLTLSDISEEAEYYPLETMNVSGVPIMFCNQFTNGIVYTNWYFDLRTIPQNLIPYASLLSSLLGKLSTETFPFGDLDNQLNIHTGSFYAELNNFMVNRNDAEMMPKFTVSAKSTLEKTGKMADLIFEILLHSKFTDADRLKSVLVRLQSNMDADIKQNGLNYARMRASSYTTNSGMFAELINGLDYYRFLTEITTSFDQKLDEIVRNIQETATLIFNRKNLIISVTCSQTELPAFIHEVERTIADWQENPVAFSPWKFDYHNRNEAMLSASKVQYVVKGYNFKKLGYEWNGKLSVLNQIISTEWLQNQIRVIGGAYGGFSSFSPYGAAYFMSYRDPNLPETLQNYDATPGFLENFSAGETAMTRFIIGTIARLDQPKTTSQKGKIAMQCCFEKTTHDMLRKERQEILSTTVEDIRKMKTMVEDILAQNTWCVYGNEAKIRENRDLFSELIVIDK